MVRNHLKIAWRNLTRNKAFTVTNLLGLVIGITSTLLIILWAKDELTYDTFHRNYDNIYQVMANRDFKNEIYTDRNIMFPLPFALEKEYPQVKNAVIISYPQNSLFEYADTRLKIRGRIAGGNFFDMFSFPFIKGNKATALSDPSNIVLTQSAAKALFGDENPLNKIVRKGNEADYKVSAIIADPPANSSLQFGFIATYNLSSPRVIGWMEEWRNANHSVYIQVTPGTDMQKLEKGINAVVNKHDPEQKISTYFTFPMKKWRLYSDFKNGKNAGGMIEYVRLFSIIAFIILLIACVNFMNLSTARSERRAREVGIRKTLGSGRKQLALQFFFESVILAFIAFIISILVVYLLLPFFNQLVNKQLVLQLNQPLFWIAGLSIVLFTGIVAGSYPAVYLSSFNPIKVLKGTFLPGKKAVLPRRILVVTQFATSVLLISATIIVAQQIQHVRNRDMGYNANNLIMVPTNWDINTHFDAVKRDLLGTGMVDAATRTLSPVTDIWSRSQAPDWKSKPTDLQIIMAMLHTDLDFTKTFNIKMLAGHDFSGTPSDSTSMLLNKAAVETMGLENPVGMQMNYGGNNYTVIGVTDNVVMTSPYAPVDPMMIFYAPMQSNFVSLRLRPSVQPQQALASIEQVFKKHNPAYPFEYRFVDEAFQEKFITEELISKITNIFAALGIFICCIGLAGLASFTIEKRFREIGIRKVLGASVQQLLILLSKEFLNLVLIAFIIAVPVTWWLMSDWLQQYAYRVNIQFWVFGIVGIGILLLTLLVVSLHTLKAALANPVKSLRSE